jgi:hypothetical protein
VEYLKSGTQRICVFARLSNIPDYQMATILTLVIPTENVQFSSFHFIIEKNRFFSIIGPDKDALSECTAVNHLYSTLSNSKNCNNLGFFYLCFLKMPLTLPPDAMNNQNWSFPVIISQRVNPISRFLLIPRVPQTIKITHFLLAEVLCLLRFRPFEATIVAWGLSKSR